MGILKTSLEIKTLINKIALGNVVGCTREIIETHDYKLEDDYTRGLATQFLLIMVNHFSKNPTFAMALYLYLTDLHGFDFSVLKTDTALRFKENFNSFYQNMTEEHVTKMEEICQKIFHSIPENIETEESIAA